MPGKYIELYKEGTVVEMYWENISCARSDDCGQVVGLEIDSKCGVTWLMILKSHWHP
jgi:hypothetical protein